MGASLQMESLPSLVDQSRATELHVAPCCGTIGMGALHPDYLGTLFSIAVDRPPFLAQIPEKTCVLIPTSPTARTTIALMYSGEGLRSRSNPPPPERDQWWAHSTSFRQVLHLLAFLARLQAHLPLPRLQLIDHV